MRIRWGFLVACLIDASFASAQATPAAPDTAGSPAVSQPPASEAATAPAPQPATDAAAATAMRTLLEQRDLQGRRCDLKASVAIGQLWYLACGDAGVWIVRSAGKG